MNTMSYSISELSKAFDVTPRAIRFYEDQGLLSPVREGTRRVYQEKDRVRLRLILRGKRLGFPLSEIKEIFDLYDNEMGEKTQLKVLIQKIQERRMRLEQQRNDIEVVLKEMQDVENRAKVALGELGQA
jgi:DNA-binding transcriptional MerR regulator